MTGLDGKFYGVGIADDGSRFALVPGPPHRHINEHARLPISEYRCVRIMRAAQDAGLACFAQTWWVGASAVYVFDRAISMDEVRRYELRQIERIDIEPDARDMTPAEVGAHWHDLNRAHDLEMARR